MSYRHDSLGFFFQNALIIICFVMCIHLVTVNLNVHKYVSNDFPETRFKFAVLFSSPLKGLCILNHVL